ncbi:MAG: urease accessory protein UreG, partial [Proteobacteria bacterium]
MHDHDDHDHPHDHGHSHDHDHPHGHTHEPYAGPGAFAARTARRTRDYGQRAFTVGVGGPVGSGKTALLLALCET